MDQIQTVVIRRGNEENTVAVLTCKQTKAIPNAERFRDALVKAVSDWVDRTTDGREAYQENGNDFNIGDLAQWDDDSALRKFMRIHGIIGFRLQIFCDTEPVSGWDYDDSLVADTD